MQVLGDEGGSLLNSAKWFLYNGKECVGRDKDKRKQSNRHTNNTIFKINKSVYKNKKYGSKKNKCRITLSRL